VLSMWGVAMAGVVPGGRSNSDRMLCGICACMNDPMLLVACGFHALVCDRARLGSSRVLRGDRESVKCLYVCVRE